MSARRRGSIAPAPQDDLQRGRVASHTFAYVIARGVPGLLTFLAIPLFTTLLEPAEYARYALMMAALSVANSLVFEWIRLAVVRFHPPDPQRLAGFTSTILTLWLTLTAAVAVVAAVALAFPAVRPFAALVLLGAALLATQSMFDLVSELCRAALRPWHFMVLQLTRAAAFVGLGFVLLRAGFGWPAPLVAVAVGMAAAVAWAWRRDWREARLAGDRTLAVEMFRYGLPISLTVALVAVVFLVDRSLVALLIDDEAAGLYSVAFDFTNQTVTVVMTAVSMAAFPIAVRELETRGAEAARRPMMTNAAFLLAVGVPATVGAAVLAPGIAGVFFGPGYATSAQVIPLVAVGALFAGLKAYHFDAALQFAHRTMQQVWIALAAAVLNVLLNLALIPALGLQGAALAAAVTFLFAMAVTAWWGRRVFPLHFPVHEAVRVVVASAAMGAVLALSRGYVGALVLVAQVVTGALVYAVLLVALDAFGLRRRITCAVRPGRAAMDVESGP